MQFKVFFRILDIFNLLEGIDYKIFKSPNSQKKVPATSCCHSPPKTPAKAL